MPKHAGDGMSAAWLGLFSPAAYSTGRMDRLDQRGDRGA